MKLKLEKTCPCGQAGEIVDVPILEDARRLVITGLASEIPADSAPKAKKAKKAKKK